jgi:hypothetical protein
MKAAIAEATISNWHPLTHAINLHASPAHVIHSTNQL